MTVNSHINSLEQKHAKLKDELHSAYTHHLSSAEIAQLKKEKLKIKDEIAKLKDEFEEQIAA